MSKEKAVVPAALQSLQLSNLQQEFSGAIDVRSSLLKIPYLKLNNAMSDAVSGQLGGVGEFSCYTRGVNFGQSVTIIPLIITESASLMDKDSSELICSSMDLVTNRDGQLCSNCPYDEYWNNWGTKTEKKIPKCKAALNLIVLTPTNISMDGRMMLSFRKTSHPAGRALLNLISSDPRKVPFGTKYTLNSQEETNAIKKKTYHVISAGKITKTYLTDDELEKVIPIARHTLEMKRSGKIVHDEESGAQKEDGSTPF